MLKLCITLPQYNWEDMRQQLRRPTFHMHIQTTYPSCFSLQVANEALAWDPVYKAMYMQTSNFRIFLHYNVITYWIEALNPYITKVLKSEGIFRGTLIDIDHLPISVPSAVSCSITSLWSKLATHWINTAYYSFIGLVFTMSNGIDNFRVTKSGCCTLENTSLSSFTSAIVCTISPNFQIFVSHPNSKLTHLLFPIYFCYYISTTISISNSVCCM